MINKSQNVLAGFIAFFLSVLCPTFELIAQNDQNPLVINGVQIYPGSYVPDAGLSGLDLSGIDFSGVNFPNANFAGSNLEGANLSRANLPEGNFKSANLKSANLTSAYLSNADLTGCNLEGADLTGAMMMDANLSNGNLANSTLIGANVEGANLSESDLLNAKLKGISSGYIIGSPLNIPLGFKIINGAILGPNAQVYQPHDFSGADLSGLDLTDAYLERANFTGANLSGVDFTGAWVYRPDFTNADLTGATFKNVVCFTPTFENTTFTGADFSGAEVYAHRGSVSGTNFSETDLTGVNFSGASLFSANFSGSDLSEANLSNAKLGPTFDSETSQKIGGGANFQNANLLNTDLSDADLSDADLEDIITADIKGLPAALPDGFRLINGYILGPKVRVPSSPDLSGGDLAGLNLEDISMPNVDFSGANLTGTKLAGADIGWASPTPKDSESLPIIGEPASLPAHWELRDGYLVDVTPPTFVLPAPQEVQVVPGDGNILLTWKPPLTQTGLTGYLVKRFNGAILENTWNLGLDDPREIRDIDLINGTLYRYAISAQVSLVEGLESTAQGTPQATVFSLVAPVRLTAIIENGGVSLSWNYPDTIELSGFELNRILSDGEERITMLPPDATDYFDNQITVGQTAIYHLSAVTENQKSPSASFEITIPHLQLDPAKMPRIVRQSNFVEGVAGANVQLFAEVEGSNPLHYIWYYNGRKMPGVTEPGIQIFNLSPEHVGTYLVEVSNPFGRIFSDPMKVEINPANLGGVDIEWNARFENSVGFESKSVGAYHEGNAGAIVAGQFTPDGSNNSDLMAVSYDDAGNQLWSTRASFSKTSQEFAHKSIQDHQGNVIISGTSRVNPAELVDDITPDPPRGPVDLPFLASFGRDGSINWTSTPSTTFDKSDFIVDMRNDGLGTIYLLGNMEDNNYKGMVIQPLSAATGESLDQILTNDSTQFTAAAFNISKDKSIYVVGQSNEASDIASGLQMRCYDVNGKLNWKTDLGTIGVYDFSPSSIHLGGKDNIYVVGSSYKSDEAGDIHVVSFNPQGEGKWQNTLGLPDGTEDIPIKAAVDHAGSIIIAGDTTPQMESTRIILGKFSNTGKADWSTLIPSSIPGMNDHITDMDVDKTGNIYLAAIRHAHGTGQDFASLRFNPDGLLIWEASFKQQGLVVEESTCIDADDQGNVILSGVTYLNTKQQIVSIRQTSIDAVENLLPEIQFNDEPFKNPVYAPGRWTVEVKAEDPDGEVTKVEFLDGAKVRGIDTEAPFTFEFASDMPTTARVFARAYDNLGGVAISEELTIVIAEKPNGSPSGTLPQEDSFLPEGSDLTLDFGITGAEPIRYQWFLNGERLKRADQPTLPILPNVTRANSGSYVLRAQNKEGKILSEPVVVSLDWQVVEGADNFEEATAIRGNTGFIRASNTEATTETGEPRHSKKRSGHSIWYRWRPDISGLTTLSLQGSSFDTLLGVYAGPSLTQLSEIESDDDRGGFSTSRLEFNAVAGVDYMIAIAGFNEANGNILFSWQLDPNQAISLPKISISPDKNTVNIGKPYQLRTSISGDLQGTILQWFRNGNAIPDANGTTLDIGSAKPEDAGVYWVSINAGNVNARTKPAHLTVNIPRRGKITRELVLEEKYADLFYFVQDFNPAPQFQPQAFGSPFQAKAASLATGFTGAQIFNTFGATKEASEPDHCGVPGGASQWFAYQAPTNGELSISTDGSDFDTVLAVYTSTGSSFDDLTEVACDNNSGSDGQDSTIQFNATEGTIYYIAVDGVEAATGTVNLAYELEVGLTVQALTIADLGMQFEITTVPNITFVIEGTEDFNNWVNLVSTSSVDGNFVYIDNEALTGKQRFYRIYVTE